MPFKLFAKTQNKSALQGALDGDQARRQTTAEAEVLSGGAEKTEEGQEPLFKRPANANAVFHVDLMGAWLKP